MNSEWKRQVMKTLDKAVGKSMDAFCSSALAKDKSKNQCAHFVSHILGFNFPPDEASCKNMNWDDKHDPDVIGATMRVDVIFNRIPKPNKEVIASPACFKPGLIFVTQKRNIKQDGSMGNMPKKHIGIVFGQWVFHYSNSADAVKKQDIASFTRIFTQVYGVGSPVIFYRGEFPQ